MTFVLVKGRVETTPVGM